MPFLACINILCAICWLVTMGLNIVSGNHFLVALDAFCSIMWFGCAWVNSASWRRARKEKKQEVLEEEKRKKTAELMKEVNFWRQKEQ